MAESSLHHPYRDLNLLRCIYSTLAGRDARFREFTASSMLDLLSRIRKEIPHARYDFVPITSEDALREALDGLVEEGHISKRDDGRYLFETHPIGFLLAYTREVPPAYEKAAFKVVPGWLKDNYPGQDL
jgi:hypothetical protein